MLIGLLVGIAIIAVGSGMDRALTGTSEQPGGSRLLTTIGNFWLAFILTVVIAPIIEEIVFRGVLFKSVTSKYGLAAGIVGSSVIFMLVHIHPLQMLSALPLGVYLAFMYHKLGSIYPGMLLHASWNFLILMIAQSAIS